MITVYFLLDLSKYALETPVIQVPLGLCLRRSLDGLRLREEIDAAALVGLCAMNALQNATSAALRAGAVDRMIGTPARENEVLKNGTCKTGYGVTLIIVYGGRQIKPLFITASR